MNIGVVGSRSFNSYSYIQRILKSFFKNNDTLISGGAKGADSLAERFCDEHGYEKIIFYPNWKKYGRKAGFIRNEDIIKNSDFVIAFWDGKSKGTKNSINLAKSLNKNYKIYLYLKSKFYVIG